MFLIAFGKLKLSDDERKSEKTNQKLCVKTKLGIKGGTGAALRALSLVRVSLFVLLIFSVYFLTICVVNSDELLRAKRCRVVFDIRYNLSHVFSCSFLLICILFSLISLLEKHIDIHTEAARSCAHTLHARPMQRMTLDWCY